MPVSKNTEVLHPAFYTEFSCIGGQCETNCCVRAWDIAIDKPSYLKYKRIRDPEFVNNMSKRIKRIRGEKASDHSYATFRRNEQGACVYLMEDGRCEMHARFGAESLCVTCRTYPRRMSQILPNMPELSLSMSCPEVVRRGLFSKDTMIFSLSSYAELVVKQNLHSVFLQKIPKGQPPKAMERVWAVREVCIDILQDRQYSIAERLFITGMLLRKITELTESEKHDEIDAVSGQFAEQVKSGQFVGANSRFGEQEDTRFLMEIELIKNFIRWGGMENRDAAYLPFEKFVENIIKSEIKAVQVGFEDLIASASRYVHERNKRLFPEFLRDYGHVLENYFVMAMFSNFFPYQFKGLTPYQYFVILVEQYAMLRMLLCGSLGEDEGFTEQHIVDCVAALSYLFEHGKMPEEIAKFYATNGIDSLAHMSFLLRE